MYPRLLALLLGACASLAAQAESLSFVPAPGSQVNLVLDGLTLTEEVRTQGQSRTRTRTFAAERPLHLQQDDFNFDGHPDFALWHLDDGMGTYTIHQVFVYQPHSGEFVERFPQCGDEFINLRVDARHKRLLSTRYAGNRPQACVTRLH